MSFKKYFAEQLQIHPSMRYADAVKLCYQAAFGAEHLLSDKARARAYLYAELEATPPTDEPLFERISEELCRVNLGAWRREGLPFEELFEAFVVSVSQRENGAETLASNLAAAESVMKENMKGFSASEWQEFLDAYTAAGAPPIHHSDHYREKESPHYRVVAYEQLDKWEEKK